ncbi:hypothetical protein ACFL6U_19340, partial [Planctomycetota bacterium]
MTLSKRVPVTNRDPSYCLRNSQTRTQQVPEYLLHDLDGLPRRIDAPDVPDTGEGEPPIVDKG